MQNCVPSHLWRLLCTFGPEDSLKAGESRAWSWVHVWWSARCLEGWWSWIPLLRSWGVGDVGFGVE